MVQTTPQSFEQWIFRLITLLTLAGFILSGCGGGTPEATTPTEAPTAEASPTTAVTDTEDEATDEPTDTDPIDDESTDEPVIVPGEEARNEAGGFAVMPVAGWEIAANEGAAGFGGTVALVPAGADPQGNEGIFIISGPADIIMGTLDPESEVDEATIEEFLNSFLADAEDENITISDPEEITIDGVDGLTVSLSGEDEDMGQMEGRVVVARIDDARIFMMVGIGQADNWDEDSFNQVLESVSFFEPAEGDIMDLLDQTAVPDDMETPEGTDENGTTSSTDTADTIDTIFPLPESVDNLMSVPGSADAINYQTSLTSEEAMEFYRQALTADGATERELLTVETDGTFSMVFDGWPDANGQAVVVQGTPIGPDQLNVNVRMEDV